MKRIKINYDMLHFQLNIFIMDHYTKVESLVFDSLHNKIILQLDDLDFALYTNCSNMITENKIKVDSGLVL